ncbi:hypothetical protein [Schlesneria sp.]|uniref:hypothetical protein n=1 Tax=Schlesneria sp. TaxID=2762018 RepID=UPI002F161FC2
MHDPEPAEARGDKSRQPDAALNERDPITGKPTQPEPDVGNEKCGSDGATAKV